MLKNTKSGFTLVELLVTITILAIISVVAYQNFGGAVNKAFSGRKIGDVSTIETALQQFKTDNNFYPPTGIKDATNLWGYDSTKAASPSNKIVVTYDGQEIKNINSASSIGGGKVYGSGTWSNPTSGKQIGAKGIISQKVIGKKYLTKDLYDPEIGDLKVKDGNKKMIDFGIGRYVYSTFKKNVASGAWPSNYNGLAYNIAFTIKEEGSDSYTTKIVGDYDTESCYGDKDKCPKTLIGTAGDVLVDKQKINNTSDKPNYGVPYAVTDFAS